MKNTLLAVALVLLVTPLGKGDTIPPPCPTTATLSYYDTALPSGCGALKDFSSPSTPDPASIMVRWSSPVHGFDFIRITGATVRHNSPSLNFGISSFGPSEDLGVSLGLVFCSGAAGAAEASISVNGSVPEVISVAAGGGCDRSFTNGFPLTDLSNSVETSAMITSGLGEMYYEIYFKYGTPVAEPGSIALLATGLAGVAGLARRKFFWGLRAVGVR
jgi:hypothetical protein